MNKEFTAEENISPVINVCANITCCWEGWDNIIRQITDQISKKGKKKTVVCIDCYPGTYESVNLNALKQGLDPSAICLTVDLLKDEKEIREMVGKFIPEDDIFGRISGLHINDFFQHKKKQSIQENIAQLDTGIILVFGVGAALLFEPDLLIYADMSLYEIQQRFRRKDISNFGLSNREEEYEKHYSRGFFIDWYLGNKIKKSIFKNADFVLDTNNWQKPKMVSGSSLRDGLRKISQTPFIQAPFFDPQIWDNPDSNRTGEDFYWYYSCVPEENSILFSFGDILFESPVINAVFLYPKEMLGKTVYHLFGAELPIRMSFLDTLDAGKDEFILQVDPDTEEIKDLYGCNYIAENSYYVMATSQNANIHLGTKATINKDDIDKIIDKKKLNTNQYFNKITVKEHDHVNIPAGIPHSLGHHCVLLKVGISPDFLSYRLWQQQKNEFVFDEILLNIHKKHGIAALDFESKEHTTKSLTNQVEILHEEDGCKDEKLGGSLYNLLQLRRHIFTKPVTHHTNGNIQVINLVKGKRIIVESENFEFDPFIVNYSQTFIVPAAIENFTIRPVDPDEECITLNAFIKQ